MFFTPMQRTGKQRRKFWRFTSIISAVFFLIPSTTVQAAVAAVDLRCEYAVDPLGIDTNIPRLSWKVTDASSMRGQKQTAYQILVASSAAKLNGNNGDLWNSGKVNSDQSVNVEYVGSALSSGMDCYWKVQVYDKDGAATGWSAPARFSVGMLNQSDWAASWIGMASAGNHDCPWFRKTFTLSAIPEVVLASIGSIGYHELYVNGKKVSDAVLTPSVSDLQKRVLYVTYDIRSYLKTGDNVIALWLAPGWSLFVGVNPVMDFQLAKKPLFIGQVTFSSAGAVTGTVVSDNTWKCAHSSAIHLGAWTNSNFGGDQIDARNHIPNWNNTGLNDNSWEDATVYTVNRTLSPDLVPPNRLIDTIIPVSISNIGANKYRVDMGRLYTGWIEVALKNGTAGSKVTITASSWDGSECEFNQLDEYIYDNSGQGTFCNRFTYHEIRHIVISGISYSPALQDIKGYRVGNTLCKTGSFECSNPLLKKIFDYTLNNYANLTTGGMTVDCPHRERLGYGGDGHTSMEIALNNYDMGQFFTKWAQDWCDIQAADGSIAHTAPTIDGGGGPAWSGFVIDMPWEVYQTYGDIRLLTKTFPTMKQWLNFLDTKDDANSLLQPFGGSWGFLGDWLTPHGSEGSSTNEALLFNNCYYLYVTRIVSKIALLLGNSTDAATYAAKAEAIKTALNARFFNSTSKTYLDTRQTHCIMPLISGAVSPQYVADVMKNIENEIMVTQKGHIDAGLHGVYFMTKYLTENDRSDLIFTYANQTTYPGYGYFIGKGYDTWPEDWQGNPGSSLLHGCYNGIGAWFQEGLAGIRLDTATPGFKHFIIKPAVMGNLSNASAQVVSMYGTIVSNWMLSSGKLTHTIEIPVNSTATYYFPDTNVANIKEGAVAASSASGVQYLRKESGYSVFQVQSGNYVFTNGTPSAVIRTGENVRDLKFMTRYNARSGAWLIFNPFRTPARIMVLDMAGRTVASAWSDKGRQWVSINGIGHTTAMGFYHVRVESQGTALSRKIMVVR